MNELNKIAYKLIILCVLTVIGVFLQLFFKNIFIVFIGIFLTIISPFIIGLLYNEYYIEKEAIHELCNIINEVWKQSIKNDNLSKNEEYLKNSPIRPLLSKTAFDKEIGIVYLLAIKLYDIKWYNHKMFNLPDTYKSEIKKYIENSKNIHIHLLDYKMDLISLSYVDYTRFTPNNTYGMLIPFLNFVKLNSNKKDKEMLDNIIQCRIKYDDKYNLN